MDKRIGVVGIVVEDTNNASKVNAILHDYAKIIVGISVKTALTKA